MQTKSTWQKAARKSPQFPQLKEDIKTDIVIVGGGITGLTLAYLLRSSGKKVVVVEADQIGSGTTGYSSNHLTTDIDFGYRNVKKKFSEKVMKIVAESRLKAIDLLEEIINKEQINCDFSRTDGFLYAEKEDNIKNVEEEYTHAKKAGLSVEEVASFDLPIQAKKIIKYRNQGIFNTQKYVNQLAELLDEHELYKIYCNTEVKEVDNLNKRVKTEFGTIEAENIVLATHIPQFFNVLQTMIVPFRSYMMSIKLADDNYPEGLYWDSQEPYHYIRSYQQQNQKWLLIGGADHETGHEENVKHYKKLEKYVKQHFNVQKIENQWSAQYYEPADGLPYIGKSPFSNVFIATGFSGDGLVYGVVSAMILEKELKGEEHKWLDAYNARRFKPIASAKKFISHNAEVAKHYIKDYLRSDNLKDLKEGEGKIISYEGNKYAVSKDKEGRLVAVNAICSHMGCIVHWNGDEKTWDCPCHGSRYASTGQLLEGPAVNGLEKYDLKDEVDESKDS